VNFTNVNGPAMTYSIFAIGFLALGNNYTGLAAEEFQKGYSLYLNGPFKSWLECPPPGCIVKTTNTSNHELPSHPVPPCPNFITGAGGFLQAILYGYAGLRYQSDHMLLRPTLPPQSRSLLLRHLHFQGSLMNIAYDAKTLILSLQINGPNNNFFVIDANQRFHRLLPSTSLYLPTGLTKVFPSPTY